MGPKVHKKGVLVEKNISPPSIFEARCLGLEKIVVAVESYNITMIALYIIRLSIAVQPDC